MKIHNIKNQKIENISVKTCFAVSSILLLTGGIGSTYNFAQASAAEYSMTGSNVVLDGTNDGSTTISLKTSVARTYTATEGEWSLHEVVDPNETQTTYLTLSGKALGDSTPISGSTNAASWTAMSGEQNMSVAAGGNVLIATYNVDKDTPEGTYTISFSGGAFLYYENNTDVPEPDTIDLQTTITVSRDETGGNNNNENNNNEGNNNENNNNENNNSEDTDESNNTSAATTSTTSSGGSNGGLAVPDTGRMSQDDNGASAAVISIVSVLATTVLVAMIVRKKHHKKVDFEKVRW